MALRSLFLVTLVLATASAFAGPVEEVLQYFAGLAKIPRASKEEGPARDWVLAQKALAEQTVWGGRVLETHVDATGNVLIWIPATGRFAGRRSRPVVMQAHLDMVPAVAGVPENTPLGPYFVNGVRITQTGDWMHTLDHQTSAGFDDGIGVAIAVRELFLQGDRPARAILLTVDEEVGFTGVLKLAVPLEAPGAIIGLDGEDDNSVSIGSMGNAEVRMTTQVALDMVLADMRLLEIEVSGLQSGHSGTQIGEPRAHAVPLIGRLLQVLHKRNPEIRLVRAFAGDSTYLNKIPGGFSLAVLVPSDPGPLREVALETLVAMLKETELDAAVVPKVEYSREKVLRALSPNRTRKLADGLLQVPEGVLRRGPLTVPGTDASSNIGFFHFAWGARAAQMQIAAMPRSTHNDELQTIVAATREVFANFVPWHERGRMVVTDNFGEGPAWNSPPDSWLLQLARSQFPDASYVFEAGTVELAELARSFPHTPSFGLGIRIKDPHTVNESMSVSSLARAMEKHERLLPLIGDALLEGGAGWGCGAALATK